MPREIKVKLYQYDELNDKAKEKALEWGYDLNTSFDWWESTYTDAEDIGLKITGFDLGRAQECTGKLTEEPLIVIKKILKNHGESCETYKTAERYRATFEKLDAARNTENGFTEEQEIGYENSENELLHDLLEDYRVLLEKEYAYQTSKEAIEETIRANEYEFHEDGRKVRF